MCVDCDGTRYKGVPTNPYRVHPQIKLVSVPTIIKWTKVPTLAFSFLLCARVRVRVRVCVLR
jgi:hypothetical protein